MTVDQLHFELLQEEGGDAGKVTLQAVPDGRDSADGWLTFHLEPIQSTTPTRYTLALRSVSDRPAILPIETPNLYPAGGLGGQLADLGFRVTFQPAYPAKVRYLLTNLAKGKRGLLGWPLWYALLGITMTTLGLAAVLPSISDLGRQLVDALTEGDI